MERQSGNWKLVGILALAGMIPASHAQQVLPAAENTSHPAVTEASIRTDRLTPRQLRIWRVIERIVLARNAAANPLYPTLHSLFQRAQHGRLSIYIEIVDRKIPGLFAAGEVFMEQSTPGSGPNAVVIRLYLYGADHASVSPRARSPHGFIPFEGLRRHERYAEVLGHELIHARLLLENPAYLRICQEMRRMAQLHAARRNGRLERVSESAMREEGERINSLIEQVEKPAGEGEREIWRELLEGQNAKGKVL